MKENLESGYDCTQAGHDLHQLRTELNSLYASAYEEQETLEYINRLENQISFIKNKCDIRP